MSARIAMTMPWGAEPAITAISDLWMSHCVLPVTFLRCEIPALKWRYPIDGWSTEKRKSNSSAPTMLMAHWTTWSQIFLYHSCSGSGVKNLEDSAIYQARKNRDMTPFKQNFCAVVRYCRRWSGLTLICRSRLRVWDFVCRECWYGSPKCLYITVVIGDIVFLPDKISQTLRNVCQTTNLISTDTRP